MCSKKSQESLVAVIVFVPYNKEERRCKLKEPYSLHSLKIGYNIYSYVYSLIIQEQFQIVVTMQ